MMKLKRYISTLVLLALVGTVTAANVTLSDSAVAGAEIEITNVQIEPAVLMYNDVGTITIDATNRGSDTVGISFTELLSKDISILNAPAYERAMSLGAGNTMEFTYLVRAHVPNGFYTPRFYMSFVGGGSMQYFIPVKVDDTGLQLSIGNAPESFTNGKKQAITISVGNPRQNPLEGITISMKGDGLFINQTSSFIGDLQPGKSASIEVEVTPYKVTDLVVNASYRNGMNEHETGIAIPIEIGTSKTSANPIINNIELSTVGDHFQLTGDVTNAGLDVAKAITITAGSPAETVDPYPTYIVGSLQPDDFSSFEITFRAPNLRQVPILVQYKDEDGNSYQNTITLNLTFSGQTGTSTNSQQRISSGGFGGRGAFGFGGPSTFTIPWIWMIIGIVIVVAGIYSWKKGLVARLRKKR